MVVFFVPNDPCGMTHVLSLCVCEDANCIVECHDAKRDLFPSYSVCLLHIHVYNDKTIRQSCTINFTVNGRKKVRVYLRLETT